jgi:hypothetical protein
MPLRFYRRVRLFPGARLNFGKRGASISVGERAAHVTIGRGRIRESVGIPGSGLSYWQTQRVTTHSHVMPWLFVCAVVAFLLFGR